MASRTKNTKRNIYWGIIEKTVSLILPFASRTVLIYMLGVEYVGLGSLFGSLLGVLSFAELGIGTAIVFSMYKPIAEDDQEKICALLNFYRKAYRIIGTIILTCGLLLMPFLRHLVAGDLPNDVDMYVLFGMYLFNSVIGYFLYAYKTSLFTAHQRRDVVSRIYSVLSVVSVVAQIIVLLVLRNYYAYFSIGIIVTCAQNILVGILSRKYYPQYRCKGSMERAEIQSISEKVGGMLFQKVGNIVLNSVDTIVISAFLGLAILGIYNNYYYVITSLFGFLAVIQQALIPSVGNSIAKESKEKNYQDFRKFHFIYLWIVIWWCTCLICLYQPFMEVWVGSENMLPLHMVILFGIYFFVYKMGDLCYVYKEGVGLWWQGKFVPIISSVVNLILNLLLVNIWGLPGILISTIISAVFVNTPWGSWVLFHYYFGSKEKWVKFLVTTFSHFLKCIIVCGVTLCTCMVIRCVGLVALFVKGCICLVLPNVILLILNWGNRDFRNACKFLCCIVPQNLIPQRIMKWLEKL